MTPVANKTMPDNTRKRAGLFLEQVRSQRKAKIVQVATGVLLRKGCREFRVEDVTGACGVAKGTCYQHFGSQADLIGAAVRSLDEALAVRLLSPASHLTEPRQVLEWAVLQAVDAQIRAITQRIQQAEPSPEAPNGDVWPCCHSVFPCPYGGAVRSRQRLLRWTTRLGSPARVRPSLQLALLLALVPTYCFGLDSRGKLPNPRAIRPLARQMFKQLFP